MPPLNRRGRGRSSQEGSGPMMTYGRHTLLAAGLALALPAIARAADRPAPNPLKNVYFGAVHVHTSYSFDAFTNGTITTPADAYRRAPHPASARAATDARADRRGVEEALEDLAGDGLAVRHGAAGAVAHRRPSGRGRGDGLVGAGPHRASLDDPGRAREGELAAP